LQPGAVVAIVASSLAGVALVGIVGVLIFKNVIKKRREDSERAKLVAHVELVRRQTFGTFGGGEMGPAPIATL
jgi:hypothetical protein